YFPLNDFDIPSLTNSSSTVSPFSVPTRCLLRVSIECWLTMTGAILHTCLPQQPASQVPASFASLTPYVLRSAIPLPPPPPPLLAGFSSLYTLNIEISNLPLSLVALPSTTPFELSVRLSQFSSHS